MLKQAGKLQSPLVPSHEGVVLGAVMSARALPPRPDCSSLRPTRLHLLLLALFFGDLGPHCADLDVGLLQEPAHRGGVRAVGTGGGKGGG